MKTKKFSYVSLTIAIITLTSCSSMRNNSTTNNDQPTVKSNNNTNESYSDKKNQIYIDKSRTSYSEIDYDKWNHEDEQIAFSKKVKVKGKVIQEGGDGDKFLRVAVNGNYDKVVYVYISSENYTDVIATDDEITVYGFADGRYTYESTLGAEITIPYMEAYFYDLNENILEEESKHFDTKVYYNNQGIKIEQLTNDTFKITNNSDKIINPRVDSLDIDGLVVDEYDLTNFYGDLRPGQSRIAILKDSNGNMKTGATLNVYVKIIDSHYNKIDEFSFSYKLENDIDSKW